MRAYEFTWLTMRCSNLNPSNSGHERFSGSGKPAGDGGEGIVGCERKKEKTCFACVRILLVTYRNFH